MKKKIITILATESKEKTLKFITYEVTIWPQFFTDKNLKNSEQQTFGRRCLVTKKFLDLPLYLFSAVCVIVWFFVERLFEFY